MAGNSEYSADGVTPIELEKILKERPLMVIPQKRLVHLETFLRAYYLGKRGSVHKADKKDLLLDDSWLKAYLLTEKQISVSGNLSSFQILDWIYGDSEQTVDLYFQLLDQFRATDEDVQSVKIEERFESDKKQLFLIIREHYQQIVNASDLTSGVIYIHFQDYFTQIKVFDTAMKEQILDRSKLIKILSVTGALYSALYEMTLRNCIITIDVTDGTTKRPNVNYKQLTEKNPVEIVYSNWLQSVTQEITDSNGC